MTEEEWLKTPGGQALWTFSKFMTSVVMLTIGGAVGSLATKALGALAKERAAKQAGGKTEEFNSILDPNRERAPSATGWSLLRYGAHSSLVSRTFVRGLNARPPHLLEDTEIPREDEGSGQ